MAKMSEYLKLAAIDSNEIIKKARLNDYSLFEDAKKLDKYFNIVSYIDGSEYRKKICSFESDIRYYKNYDQSYKIPQVYKDVDLYIQEAFGGLFKKMLEIITTKGDDWYDRINSVSNTPSKRVESSSNTAKIVNSSLNGSSNRSAKEEKSERSNRSYSKSVNPYI